MQYLGKVQINQITHLNTTVTKLAPKHESQVRELAEQQKQLETTLNNLKQKDTKNTQEFKDNQKEEDNVSEKSEEDYIQVYFQEQFKDRVDPIKEELRLLTAQMIPIEKKQISLEKEAQRIDHHYDEVCRALCHSSGF